MSLRRITIYVTSALIMLLVITCIVFVTLHLKENVALEEKSITKTYFLAADEENWNYLPNENLLSPEQHEYAEKYARENDSPLRIGKVYKKAVFREYTDETYSTRKARDSWLGILGPVIVAEVGELLELHLLNNISQPVSLHAHGAHYTKENEGAFYHDGTTSQESFKVQPGRNLTYYWRIPAERGPTASDPNCIVFAYHSHIYGDRDIYTGLIGPLIVCRRGHGNSAASNMFPLLFVAFDENQSWYIDENIERKNINLTQDEIDELKEDKSFQESNLMYSVNGLMYSNLQGLHLCLGTSTTWQLIAMGNEIDLHSITFAGHSLTINDHRTDVVHLLPGKFTTVSMKPVHEGEWAIRSEVGDHFLAGMEASFSIRTCQGHHTENSASAATVPRNIRRYYISAEESLWDYAPSKMNLMDGSFLNQSDAEAFFDDGPNRIGGKYKKVWYREYVNENFSEYKENPVSNGFLGPTLRVELGEILEIIFYNLASRPYNVYSTAFVCESCSNGSTKSEVLPGHKGTYRFFISDELGPATNDGNCVAWRYFSNVDVIKDAYSGLNGFILTCRHDSLTEEGKQKGFDKEYPLLFAVMDENKSHYFEDNIAENINEHPLDTEDPDFVESNLMHSINGLMYGNLRGIDICINDTVSFLVMSMGDVVDIHVAFFRGNTFLYQGKFTDTVQLLPGAHLLLTMKPDITGMWPIECQTNDHIKGGMRAWYTVKNCENEDQSIYIPQYSRKERRYYISVEEREWNYAPNPIHILTGENITENEDSKLFVTRDANHIGPRYIKALYTGYTDDSFTQPQPKEEHLGLLGPVIKAEVGDLIHITFFNNATREYNIRPHGLVEAISYNTSFEAPIQPGDSATYTWHVPPRSGPSATGFECTNWMYYSTVDSVKDTNSGLIGPIVICKPGILDSDGSRKDVDREFHALYTVFDENESWYLDDNVKIYCEEPDTVDKDDDEFVESNKKHSINGRIFGSLQGLVGHFGDKVAWYLMGLGTEIDMHSAHFHGLTTVEKDDAHLNRGNRKDVVDLFPGTYRTVEMTFDSTGSWLFHCHVDDHLKAGMFALVTVQDHKRK